MRQVHDSITAGSRSLRCLFLEVYELEPSGHGSVACPFCGGSLGGLLLETLGQLTEPPDAMGRRACEECGHPEMRRLCPSPGRPVVRRPLRVSAAACATDLAGARRWRRPSLASASHRW